MFLYSITLDSGHRIRFDETGMILSGLNNYMNLDQYHKQYIGSDVLLLQRGLEKNVISSFSVTHKFNHDTAAE